MRTLALLVLLASTATAQSDTTLIEPDSTYRAWWREIQACAESSKPIEEVMIYAVTATRSGFAMAKGRRVLETDRAAAFSHGDWLILIGTPWLRNKARVQHEFLHVIGSPGWHNPELFQRGPCSRLVPCDGECPKDDRPPRR